MNMVEHLRDLPVALDGHAYSIWIGRGILAGAASFLAKSTADRKVLLVVDDACRAQVVEPFIGALEQHGFQVLRHGLSGGKCHKTIEEALRMYSVLEANDFARDSTLIAVGGGVIGDIAGFVAGTYFRGMNLVHVPTTLMAMVDSSVGGKAGINLLGRVNVIGCYHHPILNVIDFQFVDTLPDRDYRAGLAEIIKCAILCDPDLVGYLRRERQAVLGRDHASLLHVVERAVAIKLAHVTGDVREQGQRLKLNYGHTLGHAIEASTALSYDVFRHGEGVALGMVGAAHIERSRALDGAHVEFFRGVVNAVGVKIGPAAQAEEVVELLRVLSPDNEPGKLILVARMGAVRVAEELPRLVEAVRRAGRRVLWMCDPMHGNTFTTRSGLKTRDFDAILREIELSFDVHEAAGTHLGGLHFELTGDDVTECVGGGVSESDLDRSYLTACDPRLNYRQALEMAFRVAQCMAPKAQRRRIPCRRSTQCFGCQGIVTREPECRAGQCDRFASA